MEYVVFFLALIGLIFACIWLGRMSRDKEVKHWQDASLHMMRKAYPPTLKRKGE